jgi:dolichol-phosphate mannosyltransferase
MSVADIHIGATDRPAPPAPFNDDPLRDWIALLPQPLRFLLVGSIGLAADLCVFTIVIAMGLNPLLARLISLAIATLITWRLNRMFTFAHSGRQQGEEALRYAVVTATAQGVSYVVFAMLVLTLLHWLPQAALIAGAAVGATVSYAGHRCFSFRPHSLLASYMDD